MYIVLWGTSTGERTAYQLIALTCNKANSSTKQETGSATGRTLTSSVHAAQPRIIGCQDHSGRWRMDRNEQQANPWLGPKLQSPKRGFCVTSTDSRQ